MNIAKNMEAIFCIAVALVSVTSLAHAAVPAHQPASVAAPTAYAGKMRVVVISARRLNAFDTAGTAK